MKSVQKKPQRPKTGNHSWKTDSEGNRDRQAKKDCPKKDKPVKKQEEKTEKEEAWSPKGFKEQAQDR